MRSLWDEPAVANPPTRVWRDWLLVGVMIALAVVEALVRPDVTWRPVAFVVCVAIAFTLLWRRTRPLTVVLVAFGAATVLDLAASNSGPGQAGLYATAVLIVLPYAVCRWASGRDMVISIAFILLTHVLREVVNGRPVDLLVGFTFLLTPAALGLAVRYSISARSRQVQEYRLLEREQLARELHDTVAHHVSAIAIQAQAAQLISGSRPEAVEQALRTIESEATRALTEMRAMVGALRDGASADLAPQRGVADVARLADVSVATPTVRVEVTGDVTNLSPAVDAATYRLAQESVTNALRHARHATVVDVRVRADDANVSISVMDDGETVAAGRADKGYGLVGMAERVLLLGGTFDAGPRADRGWVVTAQLPRTDPDA